MELAHVIVAMMGSQPARVQCKTCRGEHNFKRKAAEKSGLAKVRASMKPAAASKSELRASEFWEKRLSETTGTPTPYSVKSLFEKGTAIQHPTFGLGVVEEVKREGKIVVTFRVGEKTLVHGMKV
jgi:hypothetical protein